MIDLNIHPSIHPSIHPFIHPSIYPSIYLPISVIATANPPIAASQSAIRGAARRAEIENGVDWSGVQCNAMQCNAAQRRARRLVALSSNGVIVWACVRTLDMWIALILSAPRERRGQWTQRERRATTVVSSLSCRHRRRPHRRQSARGHHIGFRFMRCKAWIRLRPSRTRSPQRTAIIIIIIKCRPQLCNSGSPGETSIQSTNSSIHPSSHPASHLSHRRWWLESPGLLSLWHSARWLDRQHRLDVCARCLHLHLHLHLLLLLLLLLHSPAHPPLDPTDASSPAPIAYQRTRLSRADLQTSNIHTYIHYIHYIHYLHEAAHPPLAQSPDGGAPSSGPADATQLERGGASAINVVHGEARKR